MDNISVYIYSKKEVKFNTNLKDIFSRLVKFGFKKRYIKKYVLPPWWKEEFAKTESGLLQTTAYISRNLTIPIKLIQEKDAPLHFAKLPNTKFKKSIDKKTSELDKSRAISYRVCKIINEGKKNTYTFIPKNAKKIRERIIKHNSIVTFKSLLVYCWEIGLPVAHISKFPDGKKPTGMSTIINNEPAITLSRNDQSHSKQLFNLAHEIAHIALGHLENNSILIDTDELMKKNGNEKEEAEANRFAIELLTGKSKNPYINYKPIKSIELKQLSESLGKRDNVDPGFIALSIVKDLSETHQKNYWGVGTKALKKIERNKKNALIILFEKLQKNIDPSKITKDSWEFLISICRPE